MALHRAHRKTGSFERGLGSFGPWSPRHRRGVMLFNVIGVILIGVGWYRSAGVGSVPTQLKWLNLAVAGLVVAGIADCLWLVRGRQGVVGQGRTVMSHPALAFVPVAGVLSGSNGESGVLLVSGPKMTRYHRTGCVLTTGKAVSTASRARHERSGLQPCEVCEP